MSGEELTPEKYLEWFDALQSGLLVGDIAGSSYLAITPSFIRQYSGIPRPADSNWLVRYVHINACNSFHPTLVDAFLESGAVVYSGYDNLVGWTFGAESTIQFFDHLSKVMDVQQAWQAVEPKEDPEFPPCAFVYAGDPEARYFHRSFFALSGTNMETPAYGWLVTYNHWDGGPGFYWSMSALDPSSKFPTGKLILEVGDSRIGEHSATDDRVSIHFDELSTGTRWTCSKEQADAGKPCTGTITIHECDDIHGSRISGSFSAQLVDVHQTDPPYITKTINGTFIAIRSKG